MNWQDKPISKLTDAELIDAIHAVVDMDINRLNKLDASRKRHKALFEKHPSIENVMFTQLVAELNEQFKIRKLKEI